MEVIVHVHFIPRQRMLRVEIEEVEMMGRADPHIFRLSRWFGFSFRQRMR
jgi:hypothetical protein